MGDFSHSIRVLHLFSNSKWTGPAEPAVNLCRALKDKGIRVDFACAPKAGSGFNKVQAVARQYGLEPLEFMHLSKHRHPVKNFLDVLALRCYLKSAPHDIIHCHLDNDTEIALGAVKSLPVPVVRSSYEGAGFPKDGRHRRFIQGCRAIIEASERARQADCEHFRANPDKFFVVQGAIDTVRFNPERPLPDMRAKLDIPRDAFLLGIVARMQTHRHYEDLFSAFARFTEKCPAARLVVVGRGTRQEEVGFLPVRDMGLEQQVHFTGYLDGDDYAGMLAAFDAGLFLTPGTDGACRAVREIMAMGKPMITSDRGMLGEIVAHERNGLVTDGTPAQLLDAMCRLYDNQDLRRAYGEAAALTGRNTFSLAHYAESILEIYDGLLARPGV